VAKLSQMCLLTFHQTCITSYLILHIKLEAETLIVSNLFHKPQPLVNIIHYNNQILETENVYDVDDVDDLTTVCLVTIIIVIGDNLTER
jgi:hypothetical protein